MEYSLTNPQNKEINIYTMDISTINQNKNGTYIEEKLNIQFN